MRRSSSGEHRGLSWDEGTGAPVRTVAVSPVLTTHAAGGHGQPAEKTDAALVQRCRQGDSTAFADLYRRHAPAVAAVCRANVRDADAVDDLVQEVFSRLWVALPTFSGDGVLRWLRRTAKHLCIDHRRRRRNSEMPFNGMIDRIALDSDPAGTVDTRESVHGVLQKLRPVDAALLQEHHLNDRPLREMAVRWGSTEKSLSVRLTRARRAFAAVGSDLCGILPLPLWLRLRWAGRWDNSGAAGTVAAMGVLHVALAVTFALAPAGAAEPNRSAMSMLSARPAEASVVDHAPGRSETTGTRRPSEKQARQTARPTDTSSTRGPSKRGTAASHIVAVPGTTVRLSDKVPGRPDYRYEINVEQGPARARVWVATKREHLPSDTDRVNEPACQAVAGAPAAATCSSDTD